ncbi:PEGA domain-containing protein [Sorangium sp. So ce1335]|uniref:PEGA domain-containing protein n=1 Tax=Sorangium sp. So ce1335 TaxID=3133335 RepID=UPI003F6488F6
MSLPENKRLPRWRRRCLRITAALALGGAALTGAAPAGAQPAPAGAQPAPAASAPAAPRPLSETLTGEAKAEYEAARILFNDGDYRNAIIKFERAYELSRDPRLLWNIALCQKNLKRYTRLLATIEQLLRDAGPQLTEQDRKDAAELIEATKAYVSRLDLQASEAGATVLVDGEEVGQTPLREPVLLDIGTRKIRVTKRGFKDVEVSEQVAGGGVVTVKATLEREVHQGRLIVAAPPDAVISLDGRVVGRGTWEGPVPSGGHALRVTASGMASHQSEVMIHDDQTRRVQISLQPLPKDSNLESWIWIGGGVVALTGVVLLSLGAFDGDAPVSGNTSPGSVALSARGGGATFVIPFGGGR